MNGAMNDYYDKFPAILKSKIYSGEFTFPPATKYIYEPFKAYRCIVRTPGDASAVNRGDMRSYPELGRRVPRGRSIDDPDWYSTSLNTSLDKLKHDMCLPKPNRKIAVGTVHQDGGPQHMKEGNTHVSWWVFEELDLSDFVFLED